jgi:hypothetical protein
MSEQIGRPVVKAWNAALAVTLAEKGRPNGASPQYGRAEGHTNFGFDTAPII